jgi:hypothetical protein
MAMIWHLMYACVRQNPVNIALKEMLARDRLVCSDCADITRDTMQTGTTFDLGSHG